MRPQGVAPRPITLTILFPSESDAKAFVKAATQAFDVPCMRVENQVTVILLPAQHELLVQIAYKHRGEVIAF